MNAKDWMIAYIISAVTPAWKIKETEFEMAFDDRFFGQK